jgi:hypothetical protein
MMLLWRRSSRLWRAGKPEACPPRPRLNAESCAAIGGERSTAGSIAIDRRDRDGAGESPSQLALGVIRACGVLLLMSGVVMIAWPLMRAGLGHPARGSGFRGAEVGPSPRILALAVERSRPGDADHSDIVGVSSWEGRGGDAIRVMARLDVPAYCYLLALEPDGRTRLVDPPDETVAPSPRTVIRHPSVRDDGAMLPDAAALQGWLLVASAHPLPPFSEWPSAPQLRWRSVVASGVWRFDGRQVLRFGQAPGPGGIPRTFSESPRPFAQLCGVLRNLPELDAVEAIVYPVRPRMP